MALQKQNVQLNFGGGLDTKTDDKNVVASNFLELENVNQTKTNRFEKRFGYDSLSKAILDGTTLTSGSALTTFKNELLAYSSEKLYSYLESLQKWDDKGENKFVLNSSTALQSDGNSIVQATHDVGAGFICTAYKKIQGLGGTSGLEIRLLDQTTNTVIFTHTQMDSLSQFPNVVYFQNKFYIFYIKNNTNYVFRSISVATPTAISGETVFSATHVNGFCHDEKVIGDRLFMAASTTATTITLRYLDSSGVLNSPISFTSASFALSISLCVQSINNVRVTWTIASRLRVELYNNDLTAALAAPYTSGVSTGLNTVVTAPDYADSTITKIFVNQNIGVGTLGIRKGTVDSANSVSAFNIFVNYMQLNSKAALIGTKYYMLVDHYNPTVTDVAETEFLVSEDGKVFSQISRDTGIDRQVQGPASNQYHVANATVTSNSISIANVELNEINSTNSLLSASTNAKLNTFDFSQINNYFDSVLGDNLHISGSVLKMYDGNNSVEHSFLQTPKLAYVSQTTAAGVHLGSPTAATTYFYRAVYAWRDNYGQLHRSLPSDQLSVDVPQVTVNYYTNTLRLYCLNLTEKNDVEIELYRTEADGTLLYKVSTFSAGTLNDKAAEYITYVDTVADIDAIEGEPLYTTGGVLENDAANSSRYITTYKNRIILLDSDGFGIQYSKIREENGPVEFNASLHIPLDERGGEGTCLIVMDDHVIIFKKRAIFALTGEGPNNLGEQDDFRLPYLINSDVGCVDPNSIIIMPDGIMFKSEKGIYLLTRGFQTQYIGAEVEAFNDSVVTSATLLSAVNQVRFTTDSNVTLMYDYFHKRWYPYKNISAVDSTIYNDSFVYLKSDGTVNSESTNYDDAGQYIKTKIVSAWIQLANIQGFERFYRLMLLGSYKSKHKLRVSFSYDFNPTWIHSVVIDMATALPVTTYGTDEYGDESPYGGEYPLYQWEIFPKLQKCESFRFKIEDFKDDDNGAAYSISNFAMIIGVKTGLQKNPNSKQFGAS